ncbi:aminoglycoside adenylyltransferase family protein [Streptomyces acidicola]|uniref:aminoglycoside adenylyltransferase family protein n=1 Tax=Streptomyces acidicola TaxID=2596892 RepID=UPI003F4E1CB2
MPPVTQLDDVLHLVRRVLGDDLTGAYLHGSAVLDGLRPSSDLDVLVVTSRRTTEDERRSLTAGLMRLSGPQAVNGPARPVELTVVARDDISPWRYPPRCEFLYGEWLREDFERGVVPGPVVTPDLAPVITMTLNGDTALLGPPTAEVLAPVPHEDLRRAIVAGVPDLLADLESDTRNVLLTLARIWTTLATGTIKSKDAAAAWALGLLPPEHRPALALARAAYRDEQPDDWHALMPRARALAAHLAAEIRDSADGARS